MSEKFSIDAKLFWLNFCAPKIKNTSQARIKPEIFVNRIRTWPEKPAPTYSSIPARKPTKESPERRIFKIIINTIKISLNTVEQAFSCWV